MKGLVPRQKEGLVCSCLLCAAQHSREAQPFSRSHTPERPVTNWRLSRDNDQVSVGSRTHGRRREPGLELSRQKALGRTAMV